MRIVGRAVAATAVVAATVVVLPASPTQAAGTFVVNTPDDLVDLAPGDGQCLATGNVCSLRAAIQEANAAPGTSTTITVDPSVPTMALTIAGGGDGDGRDDVGDLDIAPDVDVTNVGNRVTGNQFTGVDASAMSDRHFEVSAGADLRLIEVSLFGGSPAGDGGAILVSGSVTVNNSMTATTDEYHAIYGNTAGGSGGAVAVRTGGIFKVANVSTATGGTSRVDIDGNVAGGSGGAVFNEGYVHMTGAAGPGMPSHDVYLDGNQAATDGGGIDNRAGAEVVLSCRAFVRFGQAGSSGGGMINRGTVTLEGGSFDGNVAAAGGNLFNDTGATVTVDPGCEGSRFTRGFASNTGGAIHNRGSIAVNGTLDMSGEAVLLDPSRLVEAAAGGGLYQEAGDIDVFGALRGDDLEASGHGGAVSVVGGSLRTLDQGRIELEGNRSADGGGLSVQGGTMNVSILLRNNSAYSNGGNVAVSGGDVALYGPSAVLDGYATDGAGLFISDGVFRAENTTVAGNRRGASPGVDAAVRATGGAVDLRHVSVVDNEPGLSVSTPATLELHRSLLTRNTGGNCLSDPGTITGGDFNVADDSTCGPVGTDLSDPTEMSQVAAGVEPAIGTGDAEAYELEPGSPAIDFVADSSCGGLAIDQVGTTRPVDGDADGTPYCDAGSVEAGRARIIVPVTGQVRWEPTGAPRGGVCVYYGNTDDDDESVLVVTGADGRYTANVVAGQYLVAFFQPLPSGDPDDPCNGGIDHGVQPEWYRNVAVQFPPGSDDPVFPDPDDVELVTVAATPVSGIDACLGTGPGAGADAPCPASVPPTTTPPTTAPPTTAPSSTAGAGAQADDDDSGSDASVVITSSGDSSGSGGSDAAATTTGAASNGSLAHTGTGVSGPVLAGVMLIACGAMVLAARRREHRFA